MKLAMIGLGKMGLNLTQNLMDHGHEVVAYDVFPSSVKEAEQKGAIPADSLQDVVSKLPTPKVVWVMVPAGEPTDKVVTEISSYLKAGDILMDGGNSNYKDTIRRADKLKEQGIHYLDIGTSGGMEGARNGACTMIGGNEEAFRYVEKLFSNTCVENGYLYTGKPGSGHFLKMVHNGVEYGMMQSIAEGFDILEKSDFNYDYEKVAKVWNNGSVIRSWLMELMEDAFAEDANLDAIKGVMHSSGEGKWTVETALDLQASAPIIALSLMMRYRSLETDTFSGKVVAALRNQFGGHAVESK
ncbi:decarboxylating 6-phosphogluconate dehydrogenase [Aquibacillus koreensis]|uniref:Decarboxylating 6-phosphogluconate dehydrogenase n=1 Tax=Aquibacillus koreensis TaxID=279446 RepID=A0A9X3WLD6_9BACI|nr:decarboxylating 6-phosphogluconate dehydrogenase [Aquibacillus koreensis]MCT2536493.1 decarboxylating 6-phosphogluconate dehydrogenase [Aquibacillus koreensis]MDC3419419.1 decarboxylating 6-phosphogluconate dehydrogenase [Aquibacillus koreensis]